MGCERAQGQESQDMQPMTALNWKQMHAGDLKVGDLQGNGLWMVVMGKHKPETALEC